MTIQRLKSLHQAASLALKIQMVLSRRKQYRWSYPAELKIMALEQVNLSPRIKPGGVAFGSSNSSNITPTLPIPSPRPSPKIHLSPRLHYMGLPSPRILKQSQFTKRRFFFIFFFRPYIPKKKGKELIPFSFSFFLFFLLGLMDKKRKG